MLNRLCESSHCTNRTPIVSLLLNNARISNFTLKLLRCKIERRSILQLKIQRHRGSRSDRKNSTCTLMQNHPHFHHHFFRRENFSETPNSYNFQFKIDTPNCMLMCS